ncbi:MAG: SIR2 family protein [Candidatus Rokuibacteriota bacterium]
MPAYQEVAEFLRQSSAFAVLMGAGASLSSGGSTTVDIAREVLTNAGRLQPGFEADDEILTEAFFQHVAGLGRSVRYDILSGYFESLFPNIGHVYLAKIAEAAFQRGGARMLKSPPTILTTNFDYLIEGALAKWSHLLPGREFNVHILGLADEVLQVVKANPHRLNIVKVYGDVYARIMPFTVRETRELPPEASQFLRTALSHPLLVLGYSASDGLGDLLLETEARAPVWWVSPTSPLDTSPRKHRPRLKAFLESRNGRNYVESRVFSGEHGDFDRFMSSLYATLFGDAARERVEREYLPHVLAGRPPEPFPGARAKLRVLALRLRGNPALSRISIREELKLTEPMVARLLRSARELEPRYDFVETTEGITVHDRTMLHAEKLRVNPQDKTAIGREAARSVGSGALVLIDGGTTTLEVAKVLAERCQRDPAFALTILTNAVEIARLADVTNSRFKLWFVGGEVRPESLDTMGGPAARALRELIQSGALGKRRADVCFVGATGITLTEGFCVRTSLERDIKAAMLELSEKKVIVADTSKFRPSQRGWNSFAPLATDVTVVTNESENPPEDFRELVALVFAPPI